MYSMKRDTYTCDLCDFEMKWDGTDESHGEMWECEKCGTNFCSKCFEDIHGKAGFKKMVSNCNFVLCPECYKAEVKDGLQS